MLAFFIKSLLFQEKRGRKPSAASSLLTWFFVILLIKWMS
ncbi:hypothetical protein OCA8868_03236 [Octadecabacter ascidiaceicola]|uniref:Uncharacterized protein n=1 Tax=Octadecabacter ascidiaceicola TaxID=1655543 RepID=A0A238KPR1_9RHOB|nr:hypothetical protein OCA8868_03236 [Octadecabacter ascidiaceicola]